MKAGLTLIELVLVLGIISIMAVGVFVNVRANERRALENASLALQADLRYAQRRAIMEGRRHGVMFDLRYNRYRIVVDRPRRTIRTVYLPEGITLAEASGPSLMFLPRGTASAGFRVTLSSETYRQELTATVSGGRIRIFEMERN